LTPDDTDIDFEARLRVPLGLFGGNTFFRYQKLYPGEVLPNSLLSRDAHAPG